MERKRATVVRTGAGIALAAVVLVGLSVLTWRNTLELIQAGRWVDHTRNVLGQIDELLSNLRDAEGSSRGYVLTSDPDLLGRYRTSLARSRESEARLEALTADNEVQNDRLVSLKESVDAKIFAMDRDVEISQREGRDAGAESVRAGAGRQAMDEVLRKGGEMSLAEKELLRIRSGEYEKIVRRTLLSLGLGAILLFTFFGVIWALVRMDLLKRHEAEDQLRQSEAELRTTLRSIGDGVIATDAWGRVVLMNAVAEALTGWSEAAAMGKSASDVFRIVNEDTGAPVESPIERVLREGVAVELSNHTVLVPLSGDAIPIADSGAPIRDAKGKIQGAVLVFRDITEKRRAERDVQRLAAIVSSSEDAIVAESLDGTITAWNAAAERLFGFTAAEVLGKSVALLESPGFEETTMSRLGRIRKGERVMQFDTTRVHRDGHRVSVSVSVSPIRDAEGTVVGASKVIRDITERKEVELALRASEHRFRTLSDSVASFVWVANDRGEVTYWNRRWYESTGAAPEESLGESWQAFVHPEDQPSVAANWQSAIAGGAPFQAEVRFRGRDGEYRWRVARAMRIDSGGTILWIGTATDVDDLKKTAEALHSAKEAAEQAAQAKDQFLAVLSHELRTPLTPALATAQVLERRRDLPAGVAEAISLIRRNVELEALLVDDLLDLTKIARGMIELKREPVDLHELMHRVIEICRSELLGRRQTLSVGLEAREHHAHADPARMQQVLWNLLKNAIKFTAVGGEITVRSENPAGGKIRLSVQDTGIGIPAGILPRIFEPFERGPRTVSPRAGGLGLGLSISKTLVELHGGTVRAESAGEGKGSTFSIELSAYQEKSVAPASTRRGPSRAAQKLAVLLVEDHADTASALAHLLSEEGHSVTVADSIEAAMEVFTGSAFDVLITDLGLPDGSGHDLLSRLRSIRPVAGIVLSGYGMDADIARSREAGFHEHLTKPVNIGRLLRALDEIAADVGPEASVS
ncbi:MAG TPA: PAS domain S-box protein [Thermoanaerobaculia bacterium]